MSQNGRREFLTSAAAVAAALAACAAPVRRAQAACGSIYEEGDIVSKVAPYLGGPAGLAFRKQLITLDDTTFPSPKMGDLTPDAVKRTFDALTSKSVTSVTVKSPLPSSLPPGPSPGMYTLVSGDTTPGPGTRWPVVLTVKQPVGNFTSADWNKILLFVIPEPDPVDDHGHPTNPHDWMCVHPFGM
jgi:hypothetical protein